MADSSQTLTCVDCKKERKVSKAGFAYQLRSGSGRCTSCCIKGNRYRLKGDPYTRDYYKSRIYLVWSNMKTRCTNPNSKGYYRYGGRGISVCKDWESFSGFLADMLPSYKENLYLDRIDNNRGYSKDNCRWATRKEQARNTRNIERAARFSFKGESLTILEWSERLSINRTTLYMRLVRYNWPVNRALGGYCE